MRRIITTFFLVSVFLLVGSISLSQASLTDNGNGTVTDTHTGLMWLKESLPKPGSQDFKNWKQAMLWANSLTFAGYDDWRLPSALEMTSGVPDLIWSSINNEWGHLFGVEWGNPANPSEIAPMMNYPCYWYWTSTEDPANSSRAAAFFIPYEEYWLNDFKPKDTPTCYTAVRGAPKPAKAPQCRDGYDNDGNGLTDYPNDEGCTNPEDDWEYTCKGIIGLFTCRYFRTDYRWLCFKIDDSTICLERIYVIAGIIIVIGAGVWWFLRKRKARQQTRI